MTTKDTIHLNEAHILQAMVDEADLPSTVREHLSQCGHCSAEKKRLKDGLARITTMARQMTPEPRRKPSIGRAEPNSVGWPAWNWRYSLSAGAAVAAVLLIVVGSLFSSYTREHTAYLTDRETMEDEQFMAEIAKLEEDSLPPLYMEISGSSEEDTHNEPVDGDSAKATDTNEIDAGDHGNGKVS